MVPTNSYCLFAYFLSDKTSIKATKYSYYPSVIVLDVKGGKIILGNNNMFSCLHTKTLLAYSSLVDILDMNGEKY